MHIIQAHTLFSSSNQESSPEEDLEGGAEVASEANEYFASGDEAIEQTVKFVKVSYES